ncbi:Non-heme 11 kDa protein of cytochrome bc1 complex [Thelephora terrestris]|uniref:Non-heme 11 kDa protein of cytochrome bc1 complex n=1 Tax=Thelephora terrestris TaxID=56493 RepID=A0A9P6H3V1_9AGAM|nr:Non-heme 11 kDa protein of cytochrome bc1 complex [Thelephora terrestris]
MTLTSFVSSLFSTVYADAPAEEQKAEETPEASEEATEQTVEEEEEPEPEDLQPLIREECQNGPQCAPSTKHYLHCQEKVNSGKGYKGEDCVEEFLHYFFACAAPKLFSKLR